MRTELELLGEPSVYPGHPVTIAWVIVNAFPSYEAAFAKTESGYAAALASGDIPGAGGNVYAALDLLQRFREGVPFDDAIAYSNRVWQSYTSDGFRDRREPGQAQADKVTAQLRERASWWTR